MHQDSKVIFNENKHQKRNPFCSKKAIVNNMGTNVSTHWDWSGLGQNPVEHKQANEIKDEEREGP